MGGGACLMLSGGTGIPPRWPLGEGATTIGRADTSDVVLSDREVSRQHAQVRREGDRYVLVDLGSKNGTYVNGVRVAGAVRLVDGDEIQLAPRFSLVFVDGDATAGATGQTHGVAIDPLRRDVRVAGRLLNPPLTPPQFALLELLATDPTRVFSRDEIASRCYPDAAGGVSDQAIDGVVRRLRARLESVDPGVQYLAAVRGHGFRLHR